MHLQIHGGFVGGEDLGPRYDGGSCASDQQASGAAPIPHFRQCAQPRHPPSRGRPVRKAGPKAERWPLMGKA